MKPSVNEAGSLPANASGRLVPPSISFVTMLPFIAASVYMGKELSDSDVTCQRLAISTILMSLVAVANLANDIRKCPQSIPLAEDTPDSIRDFEYVELHYEPESYEEK